MAFTRQKIFHYCLPKKALTSFAGCLASVRCPRIKNFLINDFIKRYHVNMDEALHADIQNYPTFNDFFIRPLKPGVRPVADADIVSPVDGSISEMGQIMQGQMLQAKGKSYTTHELLGFDAAISAGFERGHFMTLYLSPKDYHRVHMPLDAQLRAMAYIPGRLFSVQPATVNSIPRLFSRNERLSILFDTESGPMAMVLVGATIVGAIGTRWDGDISRSRQPKQFDYQDKSAEWRGCTKQSEIGYFKLGSTVILLFSNEASVVWDKTLAPGQSIQLGQSLGQFCA